MQCTVLKEATPGERRVALVPDMVKRLTSAGYEVVIEQGAGESAGYPDSAYEDEGARIARDRAEAIAGLSVLAAVQPPAPELIDAMAEGTAVVSFLQPTSNAEIIRALIGKNVSAFSFDIMPRISRAQGMDALSSQATVTGYQSAIIAASRLPRFFPMFMTAAGTIPPAKVLVFGAGVAGLQAIATSRRLGAVVRAYDVRAAAKEEVESLGAMFLTLDLATQEGEGGYAREQTPEFLQAQQELIATHVAASDVLITTAAIPGRKAPVLVTKAMVSSMPTGSVIVDLAAESGGNCEITEAGKDVVQGGVTVIGVSNLASSMATHASFLYARNVVNLLLLMTRDSRFDPDFADDVVAGCCIAHDGKAIHALARAAIGEEG